MAAVIPIPKPNPLVIKKDPEFIVPELKVKVEPGSAVLSLVAHNRSTVRVPPLKVNDPLPLSPIVKLPVRL